MSSSPSSVTLTYDLKPSTQAMSSLQQQIATMQRSLGSTNFNAFGVAVQQVNSLNSVLERANTRVISLGTSFLFIDGAIRSMKAMVSSFLEVNQKMADINSVFQLTTNQADRLQKSLFGIAQQTATSFTLVSDAAKEFAHQGLGVEETLKRTKDAMILTRVTGLGAADAVKALTATINSFSKSGLDSTEILNKLTAVDQKYAVSSKDLIEAISRVGSTAAQAGVSFDQLIGLITAAQQTTGRGGAIIGTALNSLLQRTGRSTTIEQLSRMGVTVKDLHNNILPTLTIFENFVKSYQNWGAASRRTGEELVGGIRNLNIMQALIDDISKRGNSVFLNATQTSQGATNQASERLAQMNLGWKSAFQQLGVANQQVNENIGLALERIIGDPLKRAISGALSSGLVQALQDASNAPESVGGQIAKKLLDGLVGTLAFTAGPAIIGLLGRTLYRLTSSAIEALQKEAGIGQDLKITEQQINQLYRQGDDGLKAQLATMTSLAEKAVFLKDALQAATMAGALQQEESRNLAKTMVLQGYRPTQYLADGYIPNYAHGRGAHHALSAESHAIARGVGGAHIHDKPVLIHNFDFGSGKHGPIVANTGEFVVKNFAGGGSAIFNRHMIHRMGLPRGAVPIAAGGYTPLDPSSYGYYSIQVPAVNDLLQKAASGDETSLSNATDFVLSQTKGQLQKDALKQLAGISTDFYAAQRIRGHLVSYQASPSAISDWMANRTPSSGISKLALSLGIPNLNINEPSARENAIRKYLTSLSTGNIESLGGITGGFGGVTLPRDEMIRIIRNELRGGALDPASNSTFLGLSRSSTLTQDFDKQVKSLMKSGTELDTAFNQASQDFIKNGGTRKQLFATQNLLVNSLTDYEKSLAQETRQAELNIVQEKTAIRLKTKLNSINEQVASGGFQALSSGDQRIYAASVRRQVVNDLGYGKFNPSLLRQDIAAQKQIEEELTNRLPNIGLIGPSQPPALSWMTRLKMFGNQNQNKIAMAALAAPFLAQMLPEGQAGTSGGMAWGAARGGLSGVGAGASIGMFFPELGGPVLGAAIGGLAGAIIGLINKTSKSISEISQEADDAIRLNKEKVQNISQYLDFSSQYKEAKARGEPASYLQSLQKQAMDAASRLTPTDLQYLKIYGEKTPAIEGRIVDTQQQAQLSFAAWNNLLSKGITETNLRNNLPDIFNSSGTNQGALANYLLRVSNIMSLRMPKGMSNYSGALSMNMGGAPTVPQMNPNISQFLGQKNAMKKSLIQSIENSLLSNLNSDQKNKIVEQMNNMSVENLRDFLIGMLNQSNTQKNLENQLNFTTPEQQARITQGTYIDTYNTEASNIQNQLQSMASSNAVANANRQYRLKVGGYSPYVIQSDLATRNAFQTAQQFSLTQKMALDQMKAQILNTLGGENMVMGQGRLAGQNITGVSTMGDLKKIIENTSQYLSSADRKKLDDFFSRLSKTIDEAGKKAQEAGVKAQQADAELQRSNSITNALASIQSKNFNDQMNAATSDYVYKQNLANLSDKLSSGDISTISASTQKYALEIQNAREMSALSNTQSLRGVQQKLISTPGINQQDFSKIQGMGLNELEAYARQNVKDLQQQQSLVNDIYQARLKAKQNEGNINSLIAEQNRELDSPHEFSWKAFSSGFHKKIMTMTKDWQDFNSLGSRTADSLSSHFSNSFGDFITGAKNAKQAFNSFITGVLSDAARALADQAFQGLLRAGITSLFTGHSSSGISPSGDWTSTFASSIANTGGPIGLATGGKVPALLTGGEYYFSPQAAKSIGYKTLQSLNNGVSKFANGGMVRGGSGMRDDVPAMLAPGGFVVKKSAVQKLGPDYLNALANGGAQKRFIGGFILPGMLVGAAIGAATGGVKGALWGAVGGGLLGAAGNYAQTGSLMGAARPMMTVTPLDPNYEQVAGKWAQYGNPIMTNAPLSLGEKLALSGAGLGILGLASAALNQQDKPLTASQISGLQQTLSAAQRNTLSGNMSNGSVPVMQINPQGGYTILGYGYTPATERFADGGMVGGSNFAPMSISSFADGGMVGGSNFAPMSISSFADGGIVNSTLPTTNSSSGHTSVNITINHNANNGTSSATANSNGISPEIAKKLSDYVTQKWNELTQNGFRNGGIFRQQGRFLNPTMNAGIVQQ